MKIVVDSQGEEARIALLEGEELIELIWEDTTQTSIVGNIYLGVVQVILPSEFAFIDIGEKQNAFLQVNDTKESAYMKKGKSTLKRGQTVLVQVIKDARGKKGPHVTTQISFTSPYLVIMKEGRKRNVGISRKITNKKERKRLRNIANSNISGEYSVIIRTASQGVSQEDWVADYKRLEKKMTDIFKKSKFERPPAFMYGETSTVIKGVNELLRMGVTAVITNDTETRRLLEGEVDNPNVVIDDYKGKMPIFEFYGVAPQITQALSRRVELPCGGFLIIEKTEACWVIDVNSGSFKGRGGHEQTASIVNEEAAIVIAKQLRLRNLSGIIMVDFLTMNTRKNERRLMQKFRDLLAKDRVPAYVEEQTVLGLSFVTRKKARESLMELLYEPCPHCNGLGTKRSE